MNHLAVSAGGRVASGSTRSLEPLPRPNQPGEYVGPSISQLQSTRRAWTVIGMRGKHASPTLDGSALKERRSIGIGGQAKSLAASQGLPDRHDPEKRGNLQNVQGLTHLKHPGRNQTGDQVKQDYRDPDST